MLTILYEWKNSLTLFKKDTFLLLLYSWYKLSGQLYKHVLKYLLLAFLGWVILFAVEFFIFYWFGYSYYQFVETKILFWAFSIIFHYLTILLARPTLEKKDTHYILSKGLGYLMPLFGAYFFYILAQFLWIGSLGLILAPFIGVNWRLFDLVIAMFNFSNTTMSFFVRVFIILFLLDSKGSFNDCLRSVWCGYKMLLFNLPITLFLCGFLLIFYNMLNLISAHFPFVEKDLMYVILYPLIIALITTVYIKRVHDQCNLYLGRGTR